MTERNRRPRIAIPVPHSKDPDYANRALPQYESAVREAGGEPVRIEFGQNEEALQETFAGCDGVLLPGSRADVDPAKYHAPRHAKTATSDDERDKVDWLLLEDAYRSRKPVLAICYGLQSLNVFCAGTLVQHIESQINHSAGRAVPKAHMVKIDAASQLAKIVGTNGEMPIAVNSSHHQSADVPGKGLKIVARSPLDGIVEALEGSAPDHFVLAVQWHPERSVNDGPELAESAKKIFRAFIAAAQQGQTR